MTTIINTNIASMNARRNLDATRSDLNTSVQRLSSGLRVNSAKDDSAGLAIATRMDSQMRGMNVAIRNANDATSLSQTAEGGLSQITNALQRIRELAVQSSNGTNTGNDRTNLNAEASQLKAEIDRIANTTSFNGLKLLDGSFSNQTFQVGADTTDTLNIASIADVNLAALGGVTAGSSAPATLSIPISGLNLNPTNIWLADWTVSAPLSVSNTAPDALTRANQWVSLINGTYPDLSATVSGSNLVLSSNQGFIVYTGTAAGFTEGTYNPTTASTQYLDALDISTSSGATSAISNIDVALTQINTARATLGAIQNRFSSVVDNLRVAAENQSTAKSRILDADYASETARLTRGQILQQAGTAMLAQANSMPNNVLSLLRG